MAGQDQLGLFGGKADAAEVRASPDGRALADLASRVPALVRMGTSSWSFPGWGRLVYEADGKLGEKLLARSGMGAYAGHPLHRTVGLDRAFYAPPKRDEYERLAAETPEGFRFVVKAWQAITRPDADERGRTFGDTAALRERGSANPRFLDAEIAADLVIGPAAAGLGDRLGPIVFQFPPLKLGTGRGPRGNDSDRFGGIDGFVDRVIDFASALPRGRGAIAFEFRNRELFEPGPLQRLAAGLLGAGAAIGLAHHPALPTIDRQIGALDAAHAGLDRQPFLLCRWLLRHGETYRGAKTKYEPFDRLVDADTETRGHVADVCRAAVRYGRPAYVIVNNKAEGSAPISIQRLAKSLAGASDEPGPAN